MSFLRKLKKVHPEAADADMWAVDVDGNHFPIKYVGYDTKHKPNKINFEE
jgi:hypothetical protein